MAINWDDWDEQIEDKTSDKERLYQIIKDDLANGETKDNLWRMTKICVYLTRNAQNQDDVKKEKEKSSQSVYYGEKAVKIHPNHAQTRKWYVAALGMTIKHVSNEDKVKLGNQFKVQADFAIEMLPNDYFIHYMYGRWSYELASLSWVEKALTRALYG